MLSRRDFPGGKTTGPSFGRLPNFAGDMINWFTEWASRVAKNDSVPDQVSLHFLYADGDLTTSINQFDQILSDAGIEYTGIWNVQEYGHPDQQIPSTAVWNIAQLERHNAPGLRANWRSGLELHDLLANLLGKEGSGNQYDVNDVDYWPAREYPVYVYYHQEMTGERVRTEMTEDTFADSFAVVDDSARRVRILAGSRPENGTWNVQVNDLDTVGLAESGDITVRTTKFNTAPGRYDCVADPENLGTSKVAYEQNKVILEVRQTNPAEAWAFELEF